jgi:6,7-dimethyl-8-ribityllumazine synthase
VTTRRDHGTGGEASPVELPGGVEPQRGSASGDGLRIGIVASRFNQEVTDLLLEGAVEALLGAGVTKDHIVAVSVPGAFEIPGTAQSLAALVDAVVCLGAVIRGETEHFTYVASAVQQGVVRVSLDTGTPVIFGVLTTDNLEQALARAGGDAGNKGAEAAMDAIEMANLYSSLKSAAHSTGS